MEQLTEMDYSFVQMESNRTPLHITPVMFYDQSTAPGGKVRFRDILRVFERNLHKSAVFRRKLSDHTFGLDTPYWVEDGDFDLEFHVRHIALPQPGDWRQLCILMARLHARPWICDGRCGRPMSSKGSTAWSTCPRTASPSC